MPIYTYEYENGERFETQQSMADDPLTEHEGRPCRRVILPARGVVKGGTRTHHSRVPNHYSMGVK